MLEESKRILQDYLAQRLAASYSSLAPIDQQGIVGGLQEQITIITRDEAAVVQRIAELRLVAEGDGPADALQDVLDAVLVLKAEAVAALAT